MSWGLLLLLAWPGFSAVRAAPSVELPPILTAPASFPAAAPIPGLPQATAEAAAAWAKIASQPLVRIYIAPAPGLGHQSASLSIARRLRDLGFKGDIEGVYFDSRWSHEKDDRTVTSKLAVLLPEFDPGSSQDQRIASLGMTLRPFSSFQKSGARVAIALTGGVDFINHLHRAGASPDANFADIFNADVFLRLQPKDWTRFQKSARDEVWLAGRPDPISIPSTARHQLFYEPAGRDAAQAQAARLPEGPARRRVRALMDGLGRHLLLPAYALDLDFASPQAIHRLLLGLSEALARAPLRGKSVVVPFLADLRKMAAKLDKTAAIIGNPEIVPQIRTLPTRERRRVIVAANERLRKRLEWSNGSDLQARLEGLSPGRILLVNVGPVPPAVFEYLFRRSDLPPTVAGRNAVSLARMLGIPFFSKYQMDLDEVLVPAGNLFQRLIWKAEGVFQAGVAQSLKSGLDDYDFESVADYIGAAADPHSRLRRAFQDARPDPVADDKLLAGLASIPKN